jgi:hypothetical protein
MSTNEPEQEPSRPTKAVIGISTPVLVITILAILWFTNNLDSLLVRLGAPQLTHACVDAGNSFGDALRCAIYKSNTATSTNDALNPGSQSASSNAPPASSQSTPTVANVTTATAATSTAPPATSTASGGCDCSVSDLPHRCSANLATTPGLSCSFANNAFYEYWKASGGNPNQQPTIQVWDPANGRYESLYCSSGDGVVDCSPGNSLSSTTMPPDVRFDQNAVTEYTSSQAQSYAADHYLGPNG